MDLLPARVLIVEDDVEAARAIARRLRAAGFEVVVSPSRSAADALTCNFEIGVFDVELPDGSGIELARDLLAVNRLEYVVFFSATTYGPYQRQALELGAFVPKGDGVEALLQVIATIDGRTTPNSSMVVPRPDTAPATKQGRRVS